MNAHNIGLSKTQLVCGITQAYTGFVFLLNKFCCCWNIIDVSIFFELIDMKRVLK